MMCIKEHVFWKEGLIYPRSHIYLTYPQACYGAEDKLYLSSVAIKGIYHHILSTGDQTQGFVKTRQELYQVRYIPSS